MSNIDVIISADVTGLTAKLAVAKAELSSTSAELRNMAAQMRQAGSSASEELKTGLTQAAAAAASAQGNVANLRSKLDALSGSGEHNAQVIREKLILAHEGLIGNYKRAAGSLVVLSERTGGLSGVMGALLTPTTLTIAAVGALAAAFGETVASGERMAESFGEIKAAMDATGAGFGVNKDQIASYIDNLRQLHGVNTDTATQMVEMFARQRDIGTDSYVALGQAAAGYARVTGSDVPKAAQDLVSALNGGYDSISKLDQQFPFLSTAQAQAIHDFDASGQKAQAMAVAIDALQAKFGPLVSDGLTPLQVGTNTLKDAWQGMTKAISESTWLKDFTTGLAVVELGLAKLISLLHGARDEVKEFKTDSAFIDSVAGAQVATVPSAGTPASAVAAQEQLRILREIQDENLKLKSDDAERGRIKQELARDEEALKTATGSEAPIIEDNIALLQRQQRELNNRVGAGQMQGLRDELEQELVQKRLVGDQEKQYNLQFWQEHLDQVQAGSKAEIDIRKEIASLQHDIDTKALSDEWQNYSENMRLKIEASKSNVAQQIALAEQWVEKGQSLYGDDIKNYKTALDEKTRLLQEQIQDDRKIREIALQSRAEILKIDLAGTPAPKGKGSEGIIDSLFGDVDGSGAKADLDRHMDALKAEFVAKQAEFNDIINDSNSTPVQIAEAQAKLAAASEQYAVDATNLNKQAAEQVTQAWENAFAPIEHAFDSSIEGMLRGTQTLQAGMQKLAQSMVLSFIQSGIKQAFAGLSKELASLSAPVFGQGGRLPGIGSALGVAPGVGGQTAQTTALTANTTALTSLTTALTGHGAVVTANTTATTAGTAATTSNTAEQTSNVVSNTVQTSTNTAAVAANTTALSSESAASGGGMFGKLLGFLPAFDVGSSNVPRDMVAQIHQGEIIVPAAHASDIRSGQSMLGAGSSRSMAMPDGAAENMRAAGSDAPPGSMGGNTYNSRTSGDVNLHYSPSINAHSNVDLSSMLAQQGSAMRRWLTNQMRNGSLKTQH